MTRRLSTWGLAALLVLFASTDAPTAGDILVFALGAIFLLLVILLLVSGFELIWERRGER